MTFKNLRYGLSSSVVLAASLFSVPSYAATDSIGLTVITTVEIGTCTATLVNDSDQDISVVDFGDVYISEINAKTKVKTFKLKFKDCAGIPNKKAQIKLTKRATCVFDDQSSTHRIINNRVGCIGDSDLLRCWCHTTKLCCAPCCRSFGAPDFNGDGTCFI